MDRAPYDATRYLPLQQADLHILLTLAQGEKHGYAIMQQVAEETNGQVRLGPGTLYGAIKRLRTVGLIAESTYRPGGKTDDARRRYYRLAPLGHKVLLSELERFASVVRTAATAGLIGLPLQGAEGV